MTYARGFAPLRDRDDWLHGAERWLRGLPDAVVLPGCRPRRTEPRARQPEGAGGDGALPVYLSAGGNRSAGDAGGYRVGRGFAHLRSDLGTAGDGGHPPAGCGHGGPDARPPGPKRTRGGYEPAKGTAAHVSECAAIG